MNESVLIISALCATVVILSGMGMFYSYKINKEHIKADALIKAEEIRARNQLEIEKLALAQNEKIDGIRYAGNNAVKDIYEEELHEKPVREKLR